MVCLCRYCKRISRLIPIEPHVTRDFILQARLLNVAVAFFVCQSRSFVPPFPQDFFFQNMYKLLKTSSILHAVGA